MLKMSLATILTILLSFSLSFGQEFEVSDLSTVDSPISFTGTAKVSQTETICMVTMHNKSPKSLLAVEISGEVSNPAGEMQSTGLSYDGFFKEKGFPSGEHFDLVGPDFFDPGNQGIEYVNGMPVKPPEPKKDLVCHAEFKVQFLQLEDGSMSGDYQIQKDVMVRRSKNMAILSRLVEAYNSGGQTAFDAALNENQSRSMASGLKAMAEYSKIPLIDLVRRKLAVAQKRQASGIF